MKMVKMFWRVKMVFVGKMVKITAKPFLERRCDVKKVFGLAKKDGFRCEKGSRPCEKKRWGEGGRGVRGGEQEGGKCRERVVQ